METKEFSKRMTACNNGFLHLIINLALLVGIIAGTIALVGPHDDLAILLCCLGSVVYLLHCIGFMIIQPNLARVLTFFGGNPVTAADLVGAGVIEVMYDWFNGIFQLTSYLPPATA
jgi:hypothetical protein